MACQSQIAEIFLAQGSSGQQSEPITYSLESRLCEMVALNEIQCIPADSEYKHKASALKGATDFLKRCAPLALIPTPGTISSSSISLHPFYSGVFTIDGLLNEAGTEAEELPFFVSGVTGAIVFQKPPKRGLQKVYATVQKIVANPFLFVAVNAALCIWTARRKS
jgi:hypothetical protein